MIFRFDTTEKIAAEAIGYKCADTLRKKRIQGEIPSHCFLKSSYKCVRYCLPLFLDWHMSPDDLEAQERAIAALQAQRPSNLPQKRGRKKSA